MEPLPSLFVSWKQNPSSRRLATLPEPHRCSKSGCKPFASITLIRVPVMANTSVVETSFSRLPAVLNAQIWSRDRVVMGQQVCKHLHENLLKHVRRVLLRRTTSVDALPNISNLRRYINNVVDLEWKDGGQGFCLLRVLFDLRDEGFGGSLRSLSLRASDMYTPEMISLADFLRTCTKLEDLDLSCNRLGGPELAEVNYGLVGCTSLQSLDLSQNNMRHGGAQWIAEVLPECIGLTKLNIAESNMGNEGAKRMGGKLGKCTRLTALDVSDNDFEEEGWRVLANGLSSCQSLRFLDLSVNNIGDDGAGILAEMMTSCTALTHLSLISVGIGPDGCEYLARGLAHCSSISSLEMRANGRCRNEGITAMQDILPRLQNLTHLDLSGCNIEPQGATTLAEMLANRPPPRLTHLDLSENLMGEQGVTRILEAVHLVPVSLHLDLVGNGQDPPA